MKKWLMEILVCPSCLPREAPLKLDASESEENDILQGRLECPNCQMQYPIRNGTAFILSYPFELPYPGSKYETPTVVSSYLWSHFSDLLGDPQGTSAYIDWSELMHSSPGFCLDTGCAVGRFTFEMASKFDFAVGVDNSAVFIRTAREIMIKRQKEVEVALEGVLTQKMLLALPGEWPTENVEFIVADAQALPFASKSFSSLASLNMVDKLPNPLKHLEETVRLARRDKAQFLLSDPFSWSEQSAEQKDWLGGKPEGDFAGYGLDNITAWLRVGRENPGPGWNIEKQGHVWWKIRTHRNHYELIRSCFVKAFR